LDPQRLTLPKGYGLAWHEALDSTSEEAKRRAEAGARGPLWIVAESQTQGRGRHGRAWLSPRGNLAATLLLRPAMPAAKAVLVSFVASLAVADMLDAYLPSLARFKWPNDVLVRGRKIAGILLEAGAAQGPGNPVAWLTVGIGVNLVSHPEEAAYPATSLSAESAQAPEPAQAFARLAQAFDRRLRRFQDEGFRGTRAQWLARAEGLGERIRVRLQTGEREGRFEGISDEGALILEAQSGERQCLHVGDVFLMSDRGHIG
jgi:BirA family biotin operon repressor/biotin-[acetyl-CoA-carboxylase] ligase